MRAHEAALMNLRPASWVLSHTKGNKFATAGDSRGPARQPFCPRLVKKGSVTPDFDNNGFVVTGPGCTSSRQVLTVKTLPPPPHLQLQLLDWQPNGSQESSCRTDEDEPTGVSQYFLSDIFTEVEHE